MAFSLDIRLDFNTLYNTGAIEVYRNSLWGRICLFLDTPRRIIDNIGHVACRQLGFPGYALRSALMPTPLNKRAWLYYFECSGSELDIASCNYRPLTNEAGDCEAGYSLYLTCKRSKYSLPIRRAKWRKLCKIFWELFSGKC